MPADSTRILVVDDHDDGREALRLVLEFAGYTVRDTRDAKRALFMALSWQPDVVCLDLLMPNLSGYDIAARIVAAFGEKRPLLIAVTGLATDAHRVKAAEAGFDFFVVKPYHLDLLLDLIAENHHREADEVLVRLPLRA
jgi:CheY-like chemotaxis protein